MKNRNTLWLFCLATAIFFACSEDSKTELLTPEISSEIPPDFDLSNPVHMESITQIAELHHAFYFIDADNYLYPFDGGALTCPDTYDYHAAEYVAFDDLMYFSGMIAMEFDTLIIQEGVVFQKKPDSPAPGRPECKEGEIRQSGTAGKISKEEKCTTRRGKKGTQTCFILTVSCKRQDDTVYTAKGTPGNCTKCKKNKKNENDISEVEDGCGF